MPPKKVKNQIIMSLCTNSFVTISVGVFTKVQKNLTRQWTTGHDLKSNGQ